MPRPASRARPEPRRRACPEPKRRGAPPGNLNALKTGKSSRQLRTLVFFLMAVPETRAIVRQIALAERRRRERLIADLGDAINDNARLFRAPSRRRSIAAIRRSLSPETLQLLKTIQFQPGAARPGRRAHGEGQR